MQTRGALWCFVAPQGAGAVLRARDRSKVPVAGMHDAGHQSSHERSADCQATGAVTLVAMKEQSVDLSTWDHGAERALQMP